MDYDYINALEYGNAARGRHGMRHRPLVLLFINTASI